MLKNAKKTKIVCTLGPASDSEEVLTQLVENGLNVCRFNFSHGDHAEQKVFCSGCGRELPPDEDFCCVCGTRRPNLLQDDNIDL